MGWGEVFARSPGSARGARRRRFIVPDVLEARDDVLREKLDLAALLVPGHEALVEEPAKPFQLTAAAMESDQVVYLSQYLIGRAGKRVADLPHPLDSPLLGRKHGVVRLGRVLRLVLLTAE